MKTFQFLRKFLRGACVWYTVVVLVTLLIGTMTPMAASGVKITSFLLFFPFALCISLANQLLRLEKLPRWSRFLLHYAIFLLAFVLFFWLPSNTGAKASTVFLLLVLASVIYWVLFLIIHTLYVRIRRLLEED